MLIKTPSGSSAVMSETSFRNSWHPCDTVSRELCSKLIGVEVFDAPVITPEEEDKLWLSSVLSLTSTISFWYLAESGAHQAGGIYPFDVTVI